MSHLELLEKLHKEYLDARHRHLNYQMQEPEYNGIRGKYVIACKDNLDELFAVVRERDDLKLERGKLLAEVAALKAKLLNDYDDDTGALYEETEPVLPCKFIVGATHFSAGVKVRLAQGCCDRMYAKLREFMPTGTLDDLYAAIADQEKKA